MKRFLAPLIAPLLALALSGCVGGLIQLPRGPAPLPPAEGPEVVVRVARVGPAGRQLVQDTAARCWLDGVLRAGNMTLDKRTGAIELSDDSGLLVAAHLIEERGSIARWRLSGPSIANRVIVARLVEALDRAVQTGQTGCPILRT